MSAYIKLSTLEYPFHSGDIKIESDYALVQKTDYPEHDLTTQVCEEGPPNQIDGQWFTTWKIRNLTQSEIAKQNTPKPVDCGSRAYYWDELTTSWILIG